MDKRKFLFASLSGLIGDIAWQVLKEGHDVRYFIEAEKERDIADGLVPKSKDWEKDANWADIVVFDDTLGQGTRAQALRAAGKPVIGGTPYSDNLEDDRNFGQEELKKAGVTIIPYQQFDSFDPAIEFVKKNPDRYVIKPSGEAQNVKRRLFVGEEEDGVDVIGMLEAYKRAFSEEEAHYFLDIDFVKHVALMAIARARTRSARELVTPPGTWRARRHFVEG